MATVVYEQEEKSDRGIRCPDCWCRDSRVVRTQKKGDDKVCRRRRCRHCGREFTTQEKIQS